MADYGLIGGLAEGLRAGLDTYRSEKKRRRDEEMDALALAMKKRAGAVDEFKSGLQVGDDGAVSYTPEALEDRQLEQAYKKSQTAKNMREGKGSNDIDAMIKDLTLKAKQDELNSPKHDFEQLPVENQEQIKKVAGQAGNQRTIVSSITAGLGKLNDPNISDDQKLMTARGMIKALNSEQGQDAVGAEEAKRLAGLLEYRMFNISEPGPAFGRAPISDFTTQVSNTKSKLEDSLRLNEEEIDKLYGRKKVVDTRGLLNSQPPVSQSGGSSGLLAPPSANAASVDPQIDKYAKDNNLSYDQAKRIIDGRKAKAQRK